MFCADNLAEIFVLCVLSMKQHMSVVRADTDVSVKQVVQQINISLAVYAANYD